jgi:hypothetical protein
MRVLFGTIFLVLRHCSHFLNFLNDLLRYLFNLGLLEVLLDPLLDLIQYLL